MKRVVCTFAIVAAIVLSGFMGVINAEAWTWGENNHGQLGDGTTTNRTAPVQASGLSGVLSVSGGGFHTATVRSDGTVWSWGYNNHGQIGNGTVTTNELSPLQAAGLTGVVSVSSGYYNTVALKSDGTVWTWGWNNNGQLGNGTTTDDSSPEQVSGLTGVIAIAAGYEHTVALKSDGTVWAWGDNAYGQLGDNTVVDKHSPVQVPGLTGVVSIAAGQYNTVALKSDGSVWAWGLNTSGQLGDGTVANKHVPVSASGLTGVVAIAAGYDHTVALRSDGTVWTWGLNSNGQLGDGTAIGKQSPVQVPALTGVVSVAAGQLHTVALASDGTVWAWGDNAYSELGDGTTVDKHSPEKVPGLSGITKISAGEYYTIALSPESQVLAWGANGNGELGDGTNTPSTSPLQVPGLNGVISANGGGYHTVALKSDGTVWTSGDNTYGQLGDGTYNNELSPEQVPGLTGVVAVAAGYDHTVALKSDGTVWAWGYNYYGQLGDGTITERHSPVQVSGLTGVIAIAGGEFHTVALKSDGTVWAWGWNVAGQLGDGTTTDELSPVQVPGLTGVIAIAGGAVHTVALKSDGTVWAWGLNVYGQLGDGTTTSELFPVQVPGLTGVIAVAGGVSHTAALKADGTVWAWGYNYFGQLGDGTTTNRLSPVQVPGQSGVVSVAAGYGHTVALKSDGTVWAWGYNGEGQLGDGTYANEPSPEQVPGLTGVSAIGAGYYHTLALVSDTTPPVVSAGPDVTAKAVFTQTATATDANPMTYLWKMASGPGTITFGSATALSTTITASKDGVYSIQFTATDAPGNSASSTMTLIRDTVLPVVTAGANQTKNAQFTQTATATDLNPMTYSWSMASGPGTITFGSPTALSTTISASADGTYTISFTATDAAGNSASKTMTLIWDTTPPVVSAGADKSAKAKFTQTATATDANAMTYLWSVVSGPTGGTVAFGTATAKSTTILPTGDGAYVIGFTATDAAGNSASSTMNLVWDTTPPVVSAGIDRTASSIITQTAMATDLTAMTYSWAKVTVPTGGIVTFGSATALQTTISVNKVGTYTIRFTATDALGNAASSTMTLVWSSTPYYTLTAVAGSNGSITPPLVDVAPGANQTFAIAPASGYAIGNVTVDGTSEGVIAYWTFSNVLTAHTIAATFIPTITATAGAGGSISPSGTTKVASGANQTYTLTPIAGYHVGTLTVDGSAVTPATSYTFTGVTVSHTISATFAQNSTVAITVTAGSNGSVTPAGTGSIVNVVQGTSQTFAIAPASGYAIGNVTVDGTSVGVIAYWTFSNVLTAHTIAATFIPTITATAGAGGSISPSGTTKVASGANQTYTLTPIAGYHVATLTVDGSAVTPATSYTFTGVTVSHTISATFAQNSTVAITVTAGSNGSVTPAGTGSIVNVVQGTSQTFAIAPASGYAIGNVTVDGTSVGVIAYWTFSNVLTAHTIAATFIPTITATAGAGGSISPSGTTKVASGANQTYTLTPIAGYHVATLTVDGSAVTPATSYTFTGVTVSHTISATFAQNSTVAITVTAGSNGSVTPAGTSSIVNVVQGTSQTFAIAPASGYAIGNVTVDGTSVGVIAYWTFSNVQAAHTITASFIQQ